ncbi:EAL domain-containing protein [Magnetospirillum gryphiswaldense]|uniref:Two-component sensory box protein n=1 Tax=Magnetospirillum gryphiswaldense TaxID=55518 RepID=A4U4T7_9PROT|nr:EAL domain-containing protein [Magnetospirillum gryphiswaldense]AVM72715.1 Cyclic di-GMP phosphodiesterase Gmr [Magnetospirillum gryphiswaldense MSR-1]AVM76618.1 Cyclic di-GMP phosphodiesterase Gmr [Magnetospirillum gryphiswaldense]CAM77894.1 Two-component sensory box protein [Magnetospirillum gryphiswaldense MSR-1]
MEPGGQRSGCTVLVVEDNPGDARLVELYLLEDITSPFRVLKAELLSAALGLLDANIIDVVLLDLSLPDSFGMDTLDRLRAAHPLVPVVVLTGTNDEALALQALRQGAQDYLVKGQGDGNLVRRAIFYAIERSHAASALKRSEGRFRALFANAGLGVVLADAHGRMVEANPAFLSMVGYGEVELRGEKFRDITHPDDIGLNDTLRAEVLDGSRDGFQLTKRYIAKDGRIIWAKLTCTVMREADGQQPFTVTVVEDITERKRLEDNMRLAATVFENSGDGLFVTDAENRIIHVNPAFTRITGFTADEVLGRNPRLLASGRHDHDFFIQLWTVLLRDGKWQGEIWDRRKDGEMFAGWQNIAVVRDTDGKVQNFVAVISDITTRKQVEERLSYAANHDPLTRLPNRTLFQERLTRAIARASRNHNLVALLFIDLDRFKQVNDTMGHLAGDMLLQQVAERLSSCIRQGDTVARLSGDEFTIILEDVQDPRDAAVVGHKVLRLLQEPVALTGGEAHISSSIGVSLYPTDAGDPQTLLKLADAAMYRAKHLGRNSCQFHSEAVNAEAFERLALENALRGAVDQGQFLLHYQPIFDVKSGRAVAVEALLRWRHPEVGVVAPNQFLALAEETGMIVPIGRWVFDQACRQAKLWRDAGHVDLRLHINLSPRQLRQPDLIEMVAAALEVSQLPPQALVLEVMETCVIDKAFDPSALFARFAALGVGLAIDEFGSGYSSFAFLRRLPVTILKVAQSFVRNLSSSEDESEIVTAIVALARGLHMTVVAPGIENKAQLDFLTGFGCDKVQGFLLSKPLPGTEMTEFLDLKRSPAALGPWGNP